MTPPNAVLVLGLAATIGWPLVITVFLLVVLIAACGIEYSDTSPRGRRRRLRVRRVKDRR